MSTAPMGITLDQLFTQVRLRHAAPLGPPPDASDGVDCGLTLPRLARAQLDRAVVTDAQLGALAPMLAAPPPAACTAAASSAPPDAV